MRVLLLPLIILQIQIGLSQQTNYADVADEVIMRYMDSLNLAGASVAIIHNAENKVKKSYGYANLEFDVPMKNQSIYRIWSVSKQFCAISIFKLEERGFLLIDDEIGRYLEDIPESWKTITIQQLLSNTAGIKDYLNDYPPGKKLHSTPFEVVADSTQVLKFRSGDSWSYSNSNYWVLTRLIEKVSGKPYQQFLKDEFFVPLEMNDTRKMDYFNIIKDRVSGYRNVKGVHNNSSRYLDENHLAEGDGELLSNVNDLNNWAMVLFSGKVIDQKYLDRAWNKAKLNNGDNVNASYLIYYDEMASYGMGWFISELNGKKIVWTPGAGRGFSTTIFSVPEIDLHIIVLMNARRFLIADKIAKEIALTLMKAED